MNIEKLIIGMGKPETDPCLICGMPLQLNGKCKRIHKPKTGKVGRFSGRSKSVNKYNDYK